MFEPARVSPENELSIVLQLADLELTCSKDLRILAEIVVDKAASDPFYVELARLSCSDANTPHSGN